MEWRRGAAFANLDRKSRHYTTHDIDLHEATHCANAAPSRSCNGVQADYRLCRYECPPLARSPPSSIASL